MPFGGGDVTLSWIQTDAQALTLTNVGSVTGRSSVLVRVTQTTTFTLTASNKKGTVQAFVTVTVQYPTQPPAITGFTTNPGSLGINGGNVTLLFSVNDAQSLFIDNGVGNVTGKNQITTAVTRTTTYTLTASNLHGSVTAQTTVTVYVPTAPPVINNFSASPSNLGINGGGATLSWNVSDATSLSIDNGVGVVSNKTSINVNVTQTTTFTLTATNVIGSSSRQTTVTVYVPSTPPVINAFSASPSTLPLLGGQTVLSWNVTDATTLSIDNGVGIVTSRTSIPVNVTQTTTFTLSAINVRGTSTAQTTVTVYVPTAPPTISSFIATPQTLPAGGGSVTLSWHTTDAQTLTIDNGVGNVLNRTSISVNVSATTAFKLIATNIRGTTQAIVLVTVNNPTTAPFIGSFTATPSSVPSGGAWVTLNWNVNGATSVSLDNGVGSVTGLSTKQVWVSSQLTYTLTATNSVGSSFASLTVTVSGGGGGGGERTITGKVLYGGVNQPVAGAAIDVVGYGSTTTDSSGNFSLSNVPATYDIGVTLGDRITLYKGLTRSNPTLVLYGAYPTRHTSGDIWGHLSNDDGQEVSSDTWVIFGGPGIAANSSAIDSWSDYDFTNGIDWYGTQATGNLFALAGFGTSSPRVGKSTSITLDSTIRVRDLTLSAVSAYRLAGYCNKPSAYSLDSKEVGVKLSPKAGIYVSDDSFSTYFDLYSAAVSGGEPYASCKASDGSSTSSARQGPFSWSNTSISLSIQDAPHALSPSEGATNVGTGSSFSWTGFSGGIHVLTLGPRTGYSGPTIHVVTSATSLSFPSLSQFGVSLPAGAGYAWSVEGYAPLSSTDDAANGNALLDLATGYGTFRKGSSNSRNVTTGWGASSD